MTQHEQRGRPPARPLAAHLSATFKRMRDERGWSARELAERCAAAGYPHLTRDVIASMDAGRRVDITVDELAVLTHVLGSGRGAPTASTLLADAGVAAARAGAPGWLADPDVWLMLPDAAYEREHRLMELIDRFADDARASLGLDPRIGSDPALTNADRDGEL